MEQKRICGIAVLLLVTAAELFLATYSIDRDSTPSESEQTEAIDFIETRQVLHDYFADHYTESGCSSVYVDLTHDGVEELLVLEMGPGQDGEALLLHSGTIGEECFTKGTVEVFGVKDDQVMALYEYSCDRKTQGGLYLQKQEGYAWLLQSVQGEFKMFALGEDVQSPEKYLTRGAKPLLVYQPENNQNENFAYMDELFTSY